VTREEHMMETRRDWARRSTANWPLAHGAPRYGDHLGPARVFYGRTAERKAWHDWHRWLRSQARVGLPAALREVNRRMLEQLEARRQAPAAEQLSLLGGEP
jgi:hypothetical protein